MTDYKLQSDQQLLDMLRMDNRVAFDEIYTRHWPKLYQSIFNVCRDRETSVDVCQEVFIWLWEHRNAVNVISSIKGYLFAAAKYKFISYIRKGKVKESVFTKIKELPDSYTIEENLEVKELQHIIGQITDRLPEKCREIFKMSRNEQLSNKEIAVRLGLSEKTVENQITIALRRLRGALSHMSCWFFLF
ncbi:RNA polymerase sigma-70 factor [Pedobacter nyackensis]|uniref:RNA polymerase sigma-70 factor n=1 Tax=Pedobacter nyackensis TaxID=475255 RepID=UPI00292F3771|nr:RNA polymerase sigma-70 factor [Pedobacter nyackensis]